MSGEFLKHMRALDEIEYKTVAEASALLDFKDEILDVIEAATIYNERLGVVVLDNNEKIVSLENRLLALDEKARTYE